MDGWMDGWMDDGWMENRWKVFGYLHEMIHLQVDYNQIRYNS
jgi:hypothetical protein